MPRHELAWTAPQPFWTDDAGRTVGRADLGRPQILRFASDEFMPELLAQLEQDPASLPRYRACKETWRGPVGAPVAEPEQVLQREPARMAGLRRLALRRARPAAATIVPNPKAAVLKLYQPAQMRHYLAASQLVCRTPGLPDRHVDPARQKVSLVVRRLFPKGTLLDDPLPHPSLHPEQWEEHAFLPRGKGGAWTFVGRADDEPALRRVLAGEERLGTFPSHFVGDDGQPRRLFLGSVPVGRRETYQAAQALPAPATKLPTAGPATPAGAFAPPAGGQDSVAPTDPRLLMFYTDVLARWCALAGQAMRVVEPTAALADARPDFLFDLDPAEFTSTSRTTLGDRAGPALRQAREALQTSSWYLLLDLRDFLVTHLGEGFLDARPEGPAGDLYDALAAARFDPTLTGNGTDLTGAHKAHLAYDGHDNSLVGDLLGALRRVRGWGPKLESANASFALPDPQDTAEQKRDKEARRAQWPDFLFLFADPWFGVFRPELEGDAREEDYLGKQVQARIVALGALMAKALARAPAPTAPLPEPGLATFAPTDMRDGWYVLRFAFECPACQPFVEPVVSAPTECFQMAGFFDPDAPARPVRIGLPLDVSPAGLRKFDKNAVFMLSDMLCGQIDRMKGLSLADLVLSILPWPFHKDLNIPEKGDCRNAKDLSLGMMCSLSIPIVTICALILLMIIVSILDYFFRWMPYLIACFPLPGFKGRK